MAFQNSHKLRKAFNFRPDMAQKSLITGGTYNYKTGAFKADLIQVNNPSTRRENIK